MSNDVRNEETWDLIAEQVRPVFADPRDVAEDVAKWGKFCNTICQQKQSEAGAMYEAVAHALGQEHPVSLAYRRVGGYWFTRVSSVQSLLYEQERRAEVAKMDQDDCNRFEATDVHSAALDVIRSSETLRISERQRGIIDACDDFISGASPR